MFDGLFTADELPALVDAGILFAEQIVLQTSEQEYPDVFAKLNAKEADNGSELVWANQAYIDSQPGWQCVYRVGSEFYAEYDTGREDFPAHLERI